MGQSAVRGAVSRNCGGLSAIGIARECGVVQMGHPLGFAVARGPFICRWAMAWRERAERLSKISNSSTEQGADVFAVDCH